MRNALFGVFGLLLLTPFVFSPDSIHPFTVGKALWSRALIEIACALWAVLALRSPAYRPPRSWVLVLLAAGLGTSLLAAFSGVSLQRSLWSGYERMQGVVDQAHWTALAVVLAASLRSARAWRTLLGANVAAGAALLCLTLALHAGVDMPFFGQLGELGHNRDPRLQGPIGNSAFLSIYMLTNLALALGFAARAWRRRTPGRSFPAQCAAWAAAAALHLTGLAMAGSVAGVVAAGAAAGCAALVFTVFARGGRRRAGAALLAALTVAALGTVAVAVDRGRFLGLGADVLERLPTSGLRAITGFHIERPSVHSRLAAWHAGLRGFADRPLLGWGPDNFEVVFGRYAEGFAATSEVHDYAHNKVIDLAATTGASGLAAWLALWAAVLVVLLRTAAAAPPGDRALAVFTATAAVGYLVQQQFLFDSATTSLVATLLIAGAARLEAGALPGAWRPRLPAAWAGRAAAVLRARLRRRPPRYLLGGGAIALAAAALVVNAVILSAAGQRHVDERTAHLHTMAPAIAAFPPLANTYRDRLFEQLSRDWMRLHAARPARAAALLDWADREALEALRTEPENWRIAGSLARLYRAASAHRPGYRERADEALARARRLAPNRPVFAYPLPPPDGLAALPLGERRLTLRWRPVPGAGYHQLAASDAGGKRRQIHYGYDATIGTFVTDACGGCRFFVRACRKTTDCSPWAAWPTPAQEPFP